MSEFEFSVAGSGTGSPMWAYVSTVTDEDFEEASASLDRALLKAVGLPEDMDIREFENGVYAMTEKVKGLIVDFSVSKFISVLPLLIADGEALWVNVQDKISDDVSRKDFITRTIRYVYKKHNPDLPVITEPFETMVEDMIINSIPDLIDNLESQIRKLEEKLKSIFGG